MTIAVIACGALATHINEISKRNDLDVVIHPINPLLHNHPEKIAEEVEQHLEKLIPLHEKVIVGYSDCGTYGKLHEVCKRYDVHHFGGNHCYDVFATAEQMKREFEQEPGTYVLTDYLLRSFDFSVTKQLGLDRFPDLRNSYFGNYTRLLWLAQHWSSELQTKAEQIAKQLELRLQVIDVGDVHLEEQLLSLTS